MKTTTKKEFVENLNERLKETQIAIIVDYKGLDVEAMTELRCALRKENSGIEVVKNTLLKMASEGTDVSPIQEFLTGPNAIVTCSSDPVAPAKVIVDFAKDNEKLEIKAAAMMGKLLSVDEIKALAKMPSRDVMLAQLLSAMNGVPTAAVRVLSAVPESFLNVLNAIGDEKDAA